jgi:hypothetical protein
MSFSSLLRLARHPVAVALRLLLWPTAILVLSNLAASAEDDALAGGLMAFGIIVAASFLLALADGLVLRRGALVLVWTITTVVVAGLVTAHPMVDVLVHGPDTSTWAEAVQSTLDDLPSSMAFFLVLVGVPVVLGAVTGAALRPLTRARGGPVVRPLA